MAATHRINNGLVEVIATPGVFPADPVTIPAVASSPTAVTAPAATAATNSTPYGYSQAQADAIVTSLRAVILALQTAGLIA